MRIALVHELLTMKGGAERVLKVLARMFPDAPIFTLLYDEAKLGDWFPKERIRLSMLQQSRLYSFLPTSYSLNHHLSLKRFPLAVEAWDFSDFDLVISSSSAFAHGIITNGAPCHICYVHSPARYLWDRTLDVQDRAAHGLLGSLKRSYLSRTFHRLRMWDAETAARPDVLLAASAEVQRRIRLYWHRESTVLHPPIDDSWFVSSQVNPQSPIPNPYFLIVSTLVPYKRIDLAVEACTRGNLSLVIAGDGPDRNRLQRMAGPTVQFLGYVSEEEKRSLYENASATLFPGHEDFGLVPLESMATGTPVIAFKAGGALETVEEGVTGTFFEEPTAESLLNKIMDFDHKKYSERNCQSKSQEFNESNFVHKFVSIIESLGIRGT